MLSTPMTLDKMSGSMKGSITYKGLRLIPQVGVQNIKPVVANVGHYNPVSTGSVLETCIDQIFDFYI